MNHQYHIVPKLDQLKVTGAAKRSVDAADAAGMAAHNAVTEVQMRILAHHQSMIDKGIDATWCAQALRLINEHKLAEDRIIDLKTRWKIIPTQVVYQSKSTGSIYPCNCWRNIINDHAETLKRAGVPPITATMVPESWDDAAARGC